ncbi:MAG: glycerol-3-phosphate acyltransferase [Chloroflexi bacterium]|nr:glycerol-3-phosphate acyltransferase [Chloroflexota bacterium]
MLLTAFVILLSYVFGSIPTAYLAARWLRGVDIRSRGTGQVGGSNAWHSVSRKVGVAVVLVDLLKGLLGVLIARLLGASTEVQVAAGIAAVIGHNWSLFLRLGGGRGIATMGGALLLLAPRELVVFGLFILAGLLMTSIPLGVVFGLASLPITSWLLGEPFALTIGCLAIFLLVLFKRVVPRRRWPSGDLKRVVLYRVLFDRDVRSREAWISGRARDVASTRHRRDGSGNHDDQGSD